MRWPGSGTASVSSALSSHLSAASYTTGCLEIQTALHIACYSLWIGHNTAIARQDNPNAGKLQKMVTQSAIDHNS